MFSFLTLPHGENGYFNEKFYLWIFETKKFIVTNIFATA